MQGAMTLTLAAAGLFFSFACALLLEELLFGGIFRLFFGQHTGRQKRAVLPVATKAESRDGRDDNYYL